MCFSGAKLALAGSPLTRTYTTTLSAVANAPVLATVRAEVAPETYSDTVNPDHRMRLLAGTPLSLLADVTWDGLTTPTSCGPTAPDRSWSDGPFTITLNSILQPGMLIDTHVFRLVRSGLRPTV